MADPILTKKDHNGVIVQYQCEFMENYVAESTVDAGKGIKSLKIGNDAAIIFFISKSGILTAIITSNGSDTGWGMAELSNPEYQVQSFDFYYDEGQRAFRLCYSQRKDNRSELLVSDEVVLNDENLEKFKSILNYRYKRLSQPERTIGPITMDKRGVLFGSLLKTTDALYHYFEYQNQPTAFTLPENTKEVKQLSVGRIYGEYGVFILYNIGNARTMLFKGFPETDGGEISQYRFETGGLINCFDLLDDKEGNNTLYVAGQGIYKFRTPDSRREEVAGKNNIYHKIDVSKNKHEVTVWALDKQSESLYYVTNTFQSIDPEGLPAKTIRRWTFPLKMHEDIEEFSAIKGKNFTNQLFLFTKHSASGQSGLLHFWQDAISKNWQESSVNIADLNATVKINTYSIDLHLKNTSRATLDDQIHISGKENMVLYVNNKKYFLTQGKKVSLNFTDYINIVYPVDSIAAASLVITASFLETDIVIDPSRGVQEKISEKIKSGKDLATAKRQNGKPLLPENYDIRTLDEIAATISVVAATAGTLEDSQPGNLSFSGKRPEPLTQLNFQGTVAVVANKLTRGNWLAETGNAIGDLFYSIKKGFIEVTGFVVNKVKEGLQFMIEVAGKVVKWIAATAKAAVEFLERIWEKVKVFFKDLVEFLAFLFNWDDILETKSALKMTANNCLKAVVPKIEEVKALVVDNIKELKRKVDKAAGFDNLKDDKLNRPIGDFAAADAIPTENAIDSRTNWVNSKKEVMFGSPGITANGTDTDGLKKLSTETDDPRLQKIINLIVGLFKGELSIGDFIKRIGKIFVDIAFEMIEQLASTLFDLLIGSIKLIEELLNAEIRIPILSGIYEEISGDKLSILDFTCLLVAIPMTVAYKIAHQVAPFSQMSKEAFSNRVLSSLNY